MRLKLIISCLTLSGICLGQTPVKPTAGWHLLDLKVNGLFGISGNRAYTELLKGKKAAPITVAVIDGGVDISHKALGKAIWTNDKEIAGNGKDDDNNGYIDDLHGWNFNGSSKGSFHFDNKDLVRLLRQALDKAPGSPEAVDLQRQLSEKRSSLEKAVNQLKEQGKILAQIVLNLGRERPSIGDFKNYIYRNRAEAEVLVAVVRGLKADPEYLGVLGERLENYTNQLAYLYNLDYDPRRGNTEFSGRYYGNGDVKGLEPSHGTHIAGIIAAAGGIEPFVRGVCPKARIMSLIAVPEGDALDRDLAMAIRYAADYGARVINISSSKVTSMDRKLVDSAVRYAMDKGLLIIHAAGNNGEELGPESLFPTRNYLTGGMAKAWIEVGASGPNDDTTLPAWFSNFGSRSVDVYAPGVDIFSTGPNSTYRYESGTSMAAPVVSGLAALIWSYYPKLTAMQVKEIILRSVLKREILKDKCISGGVVNAYEALKLAAVYGK